MKKTIQISENKKLLNVFVNNNQKIIYRSLCTYLSQCEHEDIVFIELNSEIEKFISNQLLIFKFLIMINKLKIILITEQISFNFLSKCFDLKVFAVIDNSYYENFNLNKLDFILINQIFISPKLLEYLFENKQLRNNYLSNIFTKKELEIISLLRENLRYNEISINLNLSINTIRMHVRNIYKKMCVKSKTELILILNNESDLINKLKVLHCFKLMKKISFNEKENYIKKILNFNDYSIENLSHKLGVSENKTLKIVDSIKMKDNLLNYYESLISSLSN